MVCTGEFDSHKSLTSYARVAFVFIISNTAIRFHTDLLEATFRYDDVLVRLAEVKLTRALRSSFRFLSTTDHGKLLNR